MIQYFIYKSGLLIFRWSGIRDDLTFLLDDLTFLLDEELSSVCLCALHSEMRNTEQLLGSLQIYSHIDAIHWMRVMKSLVSMVLKCQRAMTE